MFAMIELCVMKCMDGSLRAATPADQELLATFKVGGAVRVKTVQVSERSLKHHQLYWAGLIELAMQYWQPVGGLISGSEKHTLIQFSRWLDKKSGKTGAIANACKDFLLELREGRGNKIQLPEKSKEALHAWLKVEAGYFYYVLTPTGIRKEPRSINFNAMSQEEFNAFYKAAFNVVWNFILSRSFESEEQAENAINQLLSMG